MQGEFQGKLWEGGVEQASAEALFLVGCVDGHASELDCVLGKIVGGGLVLGVLGEGAWEECGDGEDLASGCEEREVCGLGEFVFGEVRQGIGWEVGPQDARAKGEDFFAREFLDDEFVQRKFVQSGISAT